ncbi:MAG: MBL fold metallo-hydrolase [Candidatus Helarchaeota archaeon]
MNSLNNSFHKIKNIGEVDSVSILTVIDNDFINADLETCWGLSFYIEINKNNDETILMDCSGSLFDFSQNVSKLNLNQKFSDLKAVHISHWHYDHAGNLNYVLSMISKSTPIYVPIGNTKAVEGIKKLGFNPIELKEPFKIFEGVFSTGTLGRGVLEHSLVLNIKDKGLLILLGCAHPGIIPIIEHSKRVSGVSDVYGLLGGFHISSKSETEKIMRYFKNLDLKLISPCHCTGDNAKKMIHDEFIKEYVRNGSGLKIEI